VGSEVIGAKVVGACVKGVNVGEGVVGDATITVGEVIDTLTKGCEGCDTVSSGLMRVPLFVCIVI